VQLWRTAACNLIENPPEYATFDSTGRPNIGAGGPSRSRKGMPRKAARPISAESHFR